MRLDGRAGGEPRKVHIEPGFVRTADGSCLISTGNTRVICTASVEETLPPWRRGTGLGWVTAEYAMLPASTSTRKRRDGVTKDGRSVEIQRLIGRAIRQAVDMKALGERVITLDCDVLEADGGTRTASITGAMVALTLAVDKLIREGKLPASPIRHQVAAISCGIVGDEPMLDLCYQEDSHAQVDMNVVMNEAGEYIEMQGTGEGRAFSPEELSLLLGHAKKGCEQLMEAQRQALGEKAELMHGKPWLVAASGNAHKIRELQKIFEGRYTVVPMSKVGIDFEVDETATTFEGNACLKAQAIFDATHLPTIADDSGLAVDALNGEPGVYSARYAGHHGDDEANNDLLLEKMKDVPDEKRTGAFHSVLALKLPDHDMLVAEGVCPGKILHARRGNGGFGYDPLFLYEPLDKTFAELSEEEKNTVSHRARASQKLKQMIEEMGL
ncbi:MAG: ribonuclease PH [Clostridia bacterium]|nr:ribonuclease PH [Clostridia bacterium]